MTVSREPTQGPDPVSPAVSRPESDFFSLPTGSLRAPATFGGRILFTAQKLWGQFLANIGSTAEKFVPDSCRNDPELTRRSRLISRFGILGALFGTAFGGFYALVDHLWGVGIVAVCSVGFAAMPWLLRRTASPNATGHTLCAILILGFAALCGCEGGSNGHAIAWLVSVPLCALLLLGRQAAGIWAVLSFAAGAAVVVANVAGYQMKPTYNMAWHPLINAAGYLALILFMFLLGVIFESGRERAFDKMKEANGKLATTNDLLARLNQEKNEFLGIAAHDLKNPLTVIIGSAELLKMNLPPAQANKMASNIVGAGQRMFHLIKDLLDANAIEQGRFTSNIERCDLRALAAECARNNQPHATRKEIVVCTEDGNPIWGRADRNATMQILDNLISNAVKFSPLKSTVQVQVVAANGHVCIEVKDQGPGISADDQKKLFGKFARLTAQPTGGESSTGLGLSIVKKLAEAMRGTVFCRSVLGAGATFVLQLPEWDETQPSPASAATAKIPAHLDRDIAPKPEATASIIASTK